MFHPRMNSFTFHWRCEYDKNTPLVQESNAEQRFLELSSLFWPHCTIFSCCSAPLRRQTYQCYVERTPQNTHAPVALNTPLCSSFPSVVCVFNVPYKWRTHGGGGVPSQQRCVTANWVPPSNMPLFQTCVQNVYIGHASKNVVLEATRHIMETSTNRVLTHSTCISNRTRVCTIKSQTNCLYSRLQKAWVAFCSARVTGF